jgi:hypothetical protein
MSDYKKCLWRAREAILWAKSFRENGNLASAARSLKEAAYWRCQAKWWLLDL